MLQRSLVQSLRQALRRGKHDLVTELITAMLVDVGYLPTVRWFEAAGGVLSAPGCWSAALATIKGTYKAAVIQNVIHNPNAYCHVVGVAPSVNQPFVPSFSYSVGLEYNLKFPEIICFGIPPQVADRILAAARAAFAKGGYHGTTLSAVATEAGVDPALITYYFSDKHGLFAACIEFPASFIEAVATATATPITHRGRAFMDAMLGLWEDPATGEILRSIFVTAAHEPLAMERLRKGFTASVLAVVSDSLDGPERYLRASLAASQIVGVAMTRYVWRVGMLAELPADAVARYIAPTIQRYLSGQL